jgi:hypothetical protein
MINQKPKIHGTSKNKAFGVSKFPIKGTTNITTPKISSAFGF